MFSSIGGNRTEEKQNTEETEARSGEAGLCRVP